MAGVHHRVPPVIGVVLWLIAFLAKRYVLHQETALDPTKLRD